MPPENAMTLDQFWRCPVCSAGVAMGQPATMSPPRCSGHGEMEQTTAEGFLADAREQQEGRDAA